MTTGPVAPPSASGERSDPLADGAGLPEVTVDTRPTPSPAAPPGPLSAGSSRSTPDALRPLLAALSRLEPLYHAACPQASLAAFDRCVADDFWEIGASGLRYDRAWARAALAQRETMPPDAHWRCEDWQLQALTPDLMLLSYRLIQPWRTSERMTLWQRRAGCGDDRAPDWCAVFHQGTPVLAPSR